MHPGSDSHAAQRIPASMEQMLREMYVTLSVSTPGQPCVVEMLRDGQRRMDNQETEVERLRQIAEAAEAAAKSATDALHLHAMTPQEKPLIARMGEAALIAMASVVGASVPALLAWGVLFQSSLALKALAP